MLKGENGGGGVRGEDNSILVPVWMMGCYFYLPLSCLFSLSLLLFFLVELDCAHGLTNTIGDSFSPCSINLIASLFLFHHIHKQFTAIYGRKSWFLLIWHNCHQQTSLINPLFVFFFNFTCPLSCWQCVSWVLLSLKETACNQIFLTLCLEQMNVVILNKKVEGR